MSEITAAVLNMPFELAMSDELSRRQFYDRAKDALQAAAELTKHAQDGFAAAMRENEKLRAEVARLRKETFADADRLDILEGQKEIAEARIKALEEGLRPFANEAELWIGYEETELLVEPWNNGPPSAITVLNLRQAHRLLNPTSPETNGGENAA